VSEITESTAGAVPFSALVTTYNDARHLSECLAALKFCDELVVVDLGSADASVDIATKAKAKIMRKPRVAIAEMIREETLPEMKHDWVVLVDPDEIFPDGVETQLRRAIADQPQLAAVQLAWDFYFKGKRLRTTVWGTPKTKVFLVHRRRVVISPNVHTQMKPAPGFVFADLSKTDSLVRVRHEWIDSYDQLFEKHLRYIAIEGKSRYEGGNRFSWFQAIARPGWELKRNLVDYRGLLGGPRGIFLSFFYSWYTLMAWLSLRKYQKKMAAPQASPSAEGKT
jgi:glycosyltransferase involved in cell wall biosynthesis